MIHFAYDGSLNGDWVSRYAIRMAAHAREGGLKILHVRDGSLASAILEAKLERIEAECREHGVEPKLELLSEGPGVFGALAAAVPEGREQFLICGTRIRSRGQAYLRGTVAARLLRSRRFNVLAVRVVQPGLLGHPQRLLLPLAGHPRGFRSVWPFFRLFLPQLQSLYLLRILPLGSLRLRYIEPSRERLLRQKGLEYLRRIVEEIERGCDRQAFYLDSRVAVCDDWAGEILLQASQVKARMILLGATERSRMERLLRSDGLERVLRLAPCDLGVYRAYE